LDRLLRRFLLWSVICIVSAAPSFLWASGEFNHLAMAYGVLLFIFIYTTISMTDWFERFHARPHVRRTLYIGYGARLAISIAFPVGAATDLYPGLISIGIVRNLGILPESFSGTLAVTIVQGTILNILIFIFMLLVYGILRMAYGSEPIVPRGFDVLPPTTDR
jgi:hypothetical protein